MSRAVIVLLLAGCAVDPDPAIVVGNPGSGLTVAPTGGYTIDAASVRLTLSYAPCEGGEVGTRTGVGLEDVVEHPPGRWCGLGVLSEVPLVIEGTGPEGQAFRVELPLDAFLVDLPEGWEVSEDEDRRFVLELASPDWLHRLDGWLGDGVVVVDPSHPLWGDLETAVETGTGLYEDLGADGSLDAEDRASPVGTAGGVGAPVPATYALEAGDALHRSLDGGQSWEGPLWIANALGGSFVPEDLAFGAGRYVLVGDSGERLVATSLDGVSWNAWSAPGQPLRAVAFGDGRFVAAGAEGGVVWSEDGLAWTPVQVADGVVWRAIASGDGRFVVVGEGGWRAVSEDGGERWTVTEPVGVELHLLAVGFGEGIFVATGDAGRRIRTVDGLTWTDDTDGGIDLDAVVWDQDRFVAAGRGIVRTSPDGASWPVDVGAPQLNDLTLWTDRSAVAVADNGHLVRAEDPTEGPDGWSEVLTADALTRVRTLVPTAP